MRFGDSPFAGGEVGESRIAFSGPGAERLPREGETEEPLAGSAAMIKRSLSGSASLCAVDVFELTGFNLYTQRKIAGLTLSRDGTEVKACTSEHAMTHEVLAQCVSVRQRAYVHIISVTQTLPHESRCRQIRPREFVREVTQTKRGITPAQVPTTKTI